MPLNLIVCGFLGSGKTTLIRRIVREALADRRVVVVEKESGSESVDGFYLRDGGLKVVDLRAGCICCTLRVEMAAWPVSRWDRRSRWIMLAPPHGRYAPPQRMGCTP